MDSYCARLMGIICDSIGFVFHTKRTISLNRLSENKKKTKRTEAEFKVTL